MSSGNKWFFICAISVLLLASVAMAGVAEDKLDTEDGEPRIVIRNNFLSDSGFGVYVGARNDEVIIEGNRISENAEAVRLTGVKNKTYVRNNEILQNIVGITLRNRYSDNEKGYIERPVDLEDIFISDNDFLNNEEGNILNLLKKTDGEVNKSSNDSGQAASEPEEEDNSREETSQEETGEDTKEEAGEDSNGETSSGADNAATEEIESSKNPEGSEEEVTTGSNEEGSDEQKDGSSPDSTSEEPEEPNEEPNIGESSSDNHEEEADKPANESTQANGLTREGEEVSLNWGTPLLMAGGTLIALISLLLLAKG
ncbi:right-handed parallel beta-helix repeat-containing protein [Candidatus Bipolaricaulota bacterium]|nr:right-handed parallel beta-helix repeat-containing protein [Candidatus Bipolaricaulota bacterium]